MAKRTFDCQLLENGEYSNELLENEEYSNELLIISRK